MKTHTFFYLIFFFLFFIAVKTNTQNSLYLVDTLTGTATNNKLWKAQGIGDFNGDSLADFIVCYDQYVDLYFGNTQFKQQLVHRFSLPPKDNYFKGFAYGIGDVNGDGYADLMIITGDTLYSPIYSYGEIILGGEELDTIPKFKYYPPYYWKMLMSDAMYPLGDLNGDGYNDFAIASPMNWDDGLGRIYIFKGGETLVNTPWGTLKGEAEKDINFGSSVLGIGDYNDDGYGDLLITSNNIYVDSDRVYLFLGNVGIVSDIPYKTYGPFNYLFDIKVTQNLNEDNKTGFILVSDGKLYLYSGIDSVIIFYPSKLIFGLSIGTGGDINNDGFNDLLIGNEQYLNAQNIMVGGVVGFWGGKNIDTSGNFLLEGYQKWSSFSHNLDIPGDINGDGYADVFVIAATYYNSDNIDSTFGRLYIYSYTKITGINNRDINPPTGFILNQNYPNPFNPVTTIDYQLPKSGSVTLKIFDILGNEVKTLVNEQKEMGKYTVQFDASALASGMYVYQLRANEYVSTKKMMLVK